jgi:hypothetical protein
MGEGGKAGLLQVFPYFFFDSRWIPVVMEPESINESGHMGVDNNPGAPKQLEMTRLAVFRPTPGRESNSSIFEGTFPPYSVMIFRALSTKCLALVWKNPTDRIRRSTSSTSARAMALGSDRRRKGGGHHVDLIVGALGAQNHRTEKLETAR